MTWKYFLSPLIGLGLCACTINVDGSTADSDDGKVAQTSPPLNLNIGSINDASFDHPAKLLGMVCSAYDFNVNVSEDLNYSLINLDKDGSLESPGSPDVVVSASSAETRVKCFLGGFLSGRCHAEMEIIGKLAFNNGQPEEPFAIKKASEKPTTACEGVGDAIQAARAEVITEITSMIRRHDKQVAN